MLLETDLAFFIQNIFVKYTHTKIGRKQKLIKTKITHIHIYANN